MLKPGMHSPMGMGAASAAMLMKLAMARSVGFIVVGWWVDRVVWGASEGFP